MFKNCKISTKILAVVLTISLSTLMILALISYTHMLILTKYSQDANIRLGIIASDRSKAALQNQAEAYLDKIVQKQSESVNAVFHQIRIELTALAEYMEGLYANPGGFLGKPVPFIPEAPDILPAAKYMFAPGVGDTPALRQELRLLSNGEYIFSGMLANDTNLSNIYLGTETGIAYRYSKSNAYQPDYDPRVRTWYQAALGNKGNTVWLDTYVDPFGIIGVTCSRTFTNSSGAVTGVIATDIKLEQITENILALRIGSAGYAFLLDKDGTYLAHPRYHEAGFKVNPRDNAAPSWLTMLDAIREGKDVSGMVELDGKEQYAASQLLNETGWTICVCIPLQEIITPAEAAGAEIARITGETQGYIRQTLSRVVMRFIIIFAVAAIMVVIFSYFLSLTITRPIEKLIGLVKGISQGNMDTAIAVSGSDEIAELGSVFNKMTGDIKNHIRNIQQITVEKERINSELAIAAGIQTDMLPPITPAFTNHELFSLYAKMTPAKEVGGDFYDFFFLDEAQTKLVLVIADVSGKGVPAALFMAITKSLIKQQQMQHTHPAETLFKVNTIIAEDNPQCMFVTVFLMVLDLATGQIEYANGGHNEPLLSQSGEAFCFLPLKKGLPLGVLEQGAYIPCRLTLNPGDRIYLYTDGVNEAMNPRNEQFGNARFLDAANHLRGLDVEAFDKGIRGSVADFAEGAAQSDDITSLYLIFHKRAEA